MQDEDQAHEVNGTQFFATEAIHAAFLAAVMKNKHSFEISIPAEERAILDEPATLIASCTAGMVAIISEAYDGISLDTVASGFTKAFVILDEAARKSLN